MPPSPTSRIVAAVDLGSNSFHLIVARIDDGSLHILDRLRETVRLGSGLNERGELTDEARERALDCLTRFGQRVRDMPRGSVRVVGTNTLRKARDTGRFLQQGAIALGHPIEIISGVEEARIIYLGVAHTLATDERRRLVIDIGGGSTELIVGQGFEPRYMESLYMGCVSMTQIRFTNGKITDKRWRNAMTEARLELRPVARRYRNLGWEVSVGASGTALAIARTVTASGWSEEGITLDALQALRDAMVTAGHVEALDLPGISTERAQVFPGGVAVMQALFEGLNIRRLVVSDGALREGLIYDLLGRIHHEDVRGRTIHGLMKRFQVDTAHAARVEETAMRLFDEVAGVWELEAGCRDMLGWSALLHEIGLAIAHSQYHRHGEYLLRNADLAGFSRQVQQVVAILVRSHWRRFSRSLFDEFPGDQRSSIARLAVLLRLAVVLNRSRSSQPVSAISLSAGDDSLGLELGEGYLDAHHLTGADLGSERAYLEAAGFALEFS